MPVPTRVYSDLLGTLYAATLDEARWREFLSQLCEVTDSIIAFLIRNDDGIGRRFLASGGLPPPQGERGYTMSDPVREAFVRNPRTGVIEVEDFLSHEELIRSDYYPVMEALGVAYGTCIVPRLSTRRYELISLWRGGDRPRLEDDRTELLGLLFPHIQTALKIHQALGITLERAQNAEAMLDASLTASLLLDGSGHLLYMNEAAQNLVLNKDGLLERNGQVAPTHAGCRDEFSRLISAAARQRYFAGGAMLVERGNGKRALQMLVSSFHAGASGRMRRALLLVSDPDRLVNAPDTVLRQLYGFTSAETQVAYGLVSGFSPEAIAAMRCVSVDTIRSQIKSLLMKTETRRQIDLVRMLSTIPAAPPSWFD